MATFTVQTPTLAAAAVRISDTGYLVTDRGVVPFKDLFGTKA